MFKCAFESETFPDGGVVIEFSNPKYTDFLWEGKSIESVSMQVKNTTHPDLLVQSSKKGDTTLYPLGEIGSVSFSKSTNPFSMWENGIINADTQSIFVHFQGVAVREGVEKTEWTPQHLATVNTSRWRGKSAELVKSLSQAIAGKEIKSLPDTSEANTIDVSAHEVKSDISKPAKPVKEKAVVTSDLEGLPF
jgi:hypothetical protein